MHRRLLNNRALHPIRRLVVVVLALVVAGTTAAACGGAPSAGVASLGSTTSTTTPSSAAGSSQKGDSGGGASSQGGTVGMGGITVQFAQCMRSNGLPNFPDPNGQGQVTINGVDPQSSSFEAAQRACAKYSPNGGRPPSAAQQQKMIANALKFSECMRSHGITDFPDPKISSSGGHVGISISLKAGPGSNLRPNDPKFQAAQKACQSFGPGGGKALGAASKISAG